MWNQKSNSCIKTKDNQSQLFLCYLGHFSFLASSFFFLASSFSFASLAFFFAFLQRQATIGSAKTNQLKIVLLGSFFLIAPLSPWHIHDLPQNDQVSSIHLSRNSWVISLGRPTLPRDEKKRQEPSRHTAYVQILYIKLYILYISAYFTCVMEMILEIMRTMPTYNIAIVTITPIILHDGDDHDYHCDGCCCCCCCW